LKGKHGDHTITKAKDGVKKFDSTNGMDVLTGYHYKKMHCLGILGDKNRWPYKSAFHVEEFFG
jgi:hypothetical protein